MTNLSTSFALAAGLIISLSGCKNMNEPMHSGQASKTVTLNAQNNSGQSGTATLTPMGGQTKVSISIKPGEAGVAQPAHIHAGTCDNLNPQPKYPLTSVTDGKSTTVVAAPIADLVNGNAINIHKSGPEIKTYVACGNLK